MKTLIFSTDSNRIWQLFHTLAMVGVSAVENEVFGSVENLTTRLKQSKKDICITLLVASNHRELTDLLQITDRLWDLPLIFILPDSEEDTLASVQKFYPRYVSDINSDFTKIALEIKAVIENELDSTPLLDEIEPESQNGMDALDSTHENGLNDNIKVDEKETTHQASTESKSETPENGKLELILDDDAVDQTTRNKKLDDGSSNGSGLTSPVLGGPNGKSGNGKKPSKSQIDVDNVQKNETKNQYDRSP